MISEILMMKLDYKFKYKKKGGGGIISLDRFPLYYLAGQNRTAIKKQLSISK